jgi:hypothetical protein
MTFVSIVVDCPDWLSDAEKLRLRVRIEGVATALIEEAAQNAERPEQRPLVAVATSEPPK